ncbi:MAG: DnaB-like helicase C-terminal domain-containing protein [Planctomycetota bacterium]
MTAAEPAADLCSIDAEQAVIGTLLVHGAEALAIVEEELSPSDYWSREHSVIHAAARRAYDRDGVVDAVTVAAEINRDEEDRDTFKAADGAPPRPDARESVYGLLAYAVMPSTVHAHARIVRDLAVRRRTHLAALELAEQSLDVTMTRDDTLAAARTALDDIEGVHAPESVVSVLERWQRDGPLERAATGFPTLDTMTRGGIPFGTLAIVNGAPDSSKTLLLVVLADRFADDGYVVGILAVDEDADGIVTRLMQRRNYSRDVAEERDHGTLGDMIQGVASLDRIRIYDETRSIESAAQDLAQFARRRRARAVLLVDSLQTVTRQGENPKDGPREAVTARVRALKSVAARNRMLVISTSEIGRAYYGGGDRESGATDLAAGKESGSIEYQAKVLLAMRPVRGEPNLVQVRVTKNKAGGLIHDLADQSQGIYLRLQRDVQTLTEDDGYEPAPRVTKDARRAEAAKEAQRRDAAHTAAAIAAEPGMTLRRLRVAVRARMGTCSAERVDVALSLLGNAVRIIRRGEQARMHYLDGSRVGDLVLGELPQADRAAVQAATAPPESVPQNDDDEGGSDDLSA